MCIIFFGEKIMNDELYMDIALQEAKKAYKKDEIPVGAVIVKNGKVISKAYNKKNKSNRVKDHAEILAIDKANRKLRNWRLEECEIYITLEPCPMCAGAIAWSQLGRLVYGAEDDKRGYRRYAPNVLHPKTEVISGICAEESTALMKEFFKNKR